MNPIILKNNKDFVLLGAFLVYEEFLKEIKMKLN